jgi:hypothetical protein
MKKILAIVATGLLLASCSGDDDHNPDSEYYGLRKGNLTVYKRYIIQENGTESATSRIDSVTVIGQETVAGLNYFRLHHKVYNDGVLDEESDDYRRVGDKGYLLDENGTVVHPGFDRNYTFTKDLEVNGNKLGTITYKLGDLQDIVVDAGTYTAQPYIGTINSLEGSIPAGVGSEISYQPGPGLIKYKARYISGPTYQEDRLISYKFD